MEKYLYVKATTQHYDGYLYDIEAMYKISEEDLNTLQPLFNAIKNFKSSGDFTTDGNFRTGSCHTSIHDGEPSAFEYYKMEGISEQTIVLFLDNYLPQDEDEGSYSVNSIEVFEIANIQKFL